MPFLTSPDDATVPQPVLRQVSPRDFQLLSPFVYRDPRTGALVTVPADDAGQVTDLASVPALLWGLFAPYGHQTLPALLHDRLCDVVTDLAGRRRADELFRVSLGEQHVPWTRRWLMWGAVSLDAWWHWAPLVLAGVLALTVLMATAVVAAFLLVPLWVALAVLVVPAVLGIAVRRGVAVAALAVYGLPVVVPVAAVVAVAGAVVWFVPSGAWWLLTAAFGRAGPAPIYGPMENRQRR